MPIRKTIFLLFPLFVSLLSACKKEEKGMQFYYWKQDFSLNQQQEALLDTIHTDKIYVKYFDIDYEQGSVAPKAMITFSSKPKNAQIVPCIYITNKTFDDSKRAPTAIYNPAILADKVKQLVDDIERQNRLSPYQEIQFDCDWTATTKDNYFAFLEAYKAIAREDVLVTSTLRLHQLKYPVATGVPPVERVCLMVYNVGNIKDSKETNSIFKPSIVDDYIQKSTTYPIEMDIALPVYSWAVLYRFEKLSLIFGNMSLAQLENNPWMEKDGTTTFHVTKDHYFKGNFLYKNDALRLEAISLDSLEQVMPLFKGLKSAETNLILFELSNENVLNYSNDNYETIRSSFY